MYNNLKERLNQYIKEKQIPLSKEAVDRMIKYANN